MELILKKLTDVCDLLNNQCIITGSCADFFHIDYKDIDDIDIIIETQHFNQSMLDDKRIIIIAKLVSKKDGHLLYRCLFNLTKLDILVKDINLIDFEVELMSCNDKIYRVCSKKSRYNQLMNNTYRKLKNETHIAKKLEKVNQRLEIYESILPECRSSKDA
jgi:predicted GNAT family N-acyltransferase